MDARELDRGRKAGRGNGCCEVTRAKLRVGEIPFSVPSDSDQSTLTLYTDRGVLSYLLFVVRIQHSHVCICWSSPTIPSPRQRHTALHLAYRPYTDSQRHK